MTKMQEYCTNILNAIFMRAIELQYKFQFALEG